MASRRPLALLLGAASSVPALALLFAATVDAFSACNSGGNRCAPKNTEHRHECPRARQATALRSSPFFGVGGGWDNDDFLDSLNAPPSEPSPDAATDEEPEGTVQQPQPQPQQSFQYQQPRPQPQRPRQTQTQPQQPQPQPQSPTVSAHSVGPLPLGWSAHFDPASRNLYYYNVADGTSTWVKPPLGPPPPPPPAGPPPSGGAPHAVERTEMTDALADAAAADAGSEDSELDDAETTTIPSEPLEGATITPAMKAKMKGSHTTEEEESGGGVKFRSMLERAMSTKMSAGTQRKRGVAVEVPPELENAPVSELAAYLHESMWRQQNPDFASRPAQTYQSPGIGFDGRKIGRNRDVDIVSNSADVYLARLKRDSTTRNLARYAGDDAKANTVFGDASVAEIKEPEENPYLKERRERERDMLQTVPEEMLVFREYGEAQRQPGWKGVSYRDRLAEAKAKKRPPQ